MRAHRRGDSESKEPKSAVRTLRETVKNAYDARRAETLEALQRQIQGRDGIARLVASNANKIVDGTLDYVLAVAS